MQATRHRPVRCLPLGALCLAVFVHLVGSGPAQAQTVYLENFSNTNNNSNAFTEFGWGSIGSNATATSNTTANASTTVLLSSNAAGPQTTLAGINNTGNFTNPTNGAAGSGFAYFSTNNGYDRVLAFTRPSVEYFGAGRTLNASDLLGISIQTGSSSSGNVRPAVLVDSTWYVLSSGLTAGSAATAGNFTGTAAQTQTWDSTVFAGTNWAVLDTSAPGFSISNTTGALAAGNVNSLGFYYTSVINTGTQRFDNFTVSAIPEPSTTALLAAAIFLGQFLLRQKCRPT